MARKIPDMARTAAAIDALDAAYPALRERMESGTLREVDQASKEWVALEIAVGEAFGEDTKDRNNPETCRACVRAGNKVPPPGQEESFARRMVRLWREQQVCP